MKINLIKNDFGTTKNFIITVLSCVACTFIMAFGVSIFLVPQKIAAGGFTGLATLINYITGTKLSVGAIVFLLNLPLFILSTKNLGSKFGLLSIISTISYTVFIDVVKVLSITPTLIEAIQDKTLCVIYGSVLLGAGLGSIVKMGGSTGGSDMLANLIVNKINFAKIGFSVFAIDATVIAASFFVYKDFQAPLYAFIATFLSAKIIDYIIEGGKINKVYYIFSDKAEEIGEEIVKKLKRGATIWSGTGIYTKKERQVLMCLVLRSQSGSLKSLIKQVDPKAFLFCTNSTEAFGEGFTPMNK